MQRIHEVLALLKPNGRSGAGTVEIVSALAEGADTLVARAALATGSRLRVLLPFAPDDYETTFSDKSHKGEFRKLMREADACVSLKGSLRRSEAGYEAVGLATLDHSDMVLTIWDGGAAQGRGGTPDILHAALARRLPVIWISATEDRAPRLVRAGARGPIPRLDRAARKAGKLGAREVKELVAAACERRRRSE